MAVYARIATSSLPMVSSASRTTPTWPSIMPLGPHDVDAGVRLHLGHLGVPLQGGVVVDAPPRRPARRSARGRCTRRGTGRDITTSSSPTSARTSRMATWRIPSGSVPAVPRASFLDSSGTPNSMIPETPASTASTAAFRRSVAAVLDDAGHGLNRHGLADTLPHEGGQDQVRRMQPRLRDHPPHHGRGTQPRAPRPGKGSVHCHAFTLRPPHRCLCRRPVGAGPAPPAGATPLGGPHPPADVPGRRPARPRPQRPPPFAHLRPRRPQ